VTDRDDDALGETVEAGVRIFLGAVPSLEPSTTPGVRALLTPVQARWSRLGFDPARMAEIVVTPSCGLAGASPGWARTATTLSRDLARALEDASNDELVLEGER
jgi:hypothetical protein